MRGDAEQRLLLREEIRKLTGQTAFTDETRMDKDRNFWIMLLTARNTKRLEATPGEGPPFIVNLQLLSLDAEFESEQQLAVFTTEEKALAYGWHVEDQTDRDWQMFAPVRLTQAQIRELIFEGNPHGVCAVDPIPDGESFVIGVNGLHLV